MITDIELLAKEYLPDEAAIQVLRDSRIVLLVGIMSAGKDTLQSRLVLSPDYHSITTHTTRSPRLNMGILEQDGLQYHFVSRDQMKDLLLTHSMIEVNQFGENFYGTSLSEFQGANQAGKIALGDIDIHGIAAFYDIAPRSVTAIFVVPPDYTTWLERLHKRYDSKDAFEQEWKTRKTITINELEYALQVPYYHFVINDDIERATGVINEISHQENDTFGRGDDTARLAARDLLEDIKAS